jgi:hypothetical protein
MCQAGAVGDQRLTSDNRIGRRNELICIGVLDRALTFSIT